MPSEISVNIGLNQNVTCKIEGSCDFSIHEVERLLRIYFMMNKADREHAFYALAGMSTSSNINDSERVKKIQLLLSAEIANDRS